MWCRTATHFPHLDHVKYLVLDVHGIRWLDVVLDQRACDVPKEEIDRVRVEVRPGGESDESPEVPEALLCLFVFHGKHKIKECLVVHFSLLGSRRPRLRRLVGGDLGEDAVNEGRSEADRLPGGAYVRVERGDTQAKRGAKRD